MKYGIYVLGILFFALTVYSYVYITALRHDVITLRNKCEEYEIRITGVELEFIDESLYESRYDMWHGGDTTNRNIILESP